MPSAAYPENIASILEHNRAFVAAGEGEGLASPKRPGKRVAVLSCMDTRLTYLLPRALGLDGGDAKLIKVAGATVIDAYGEVMRSLLVAVAELGVTDIMVVGHTDCGTCGMDPHHMLDELVEAGLPREQLDAALSVGDSDDRGRIERFLTGFDELESDVVATVARIQQHPLMPPTVRVWGFAIDIETGALAPVA